MTKGFTQTKTNLALGSAFTRDMTGHPTQVDACRRFTISLDAIATVFKDLVSYIQRDVFNKIASIHFTSSDELYKLGALKCLRAKTAAELASLLPSILDRAFKGEL